MESKTNKILAKGSLGIGLFQKIGKAMKLPSLSRITMESAIGNCDHYQASEVYGVYKLNAECQKASIQTEVQRMQRNR